MPTPHETPVDVEAPENHVAHAAASRETKRTSDSVSVATGTFGSLPQRFGRYQVERLLGRGAMGTVYLARDTHLGRAVALKIPKVAATSSNRLLRRLETEAKTAANLDHPGICKVYDAGQVDGQCFIAMQFIEGKTLKCHLNAQRKSLPEAVSLILKLASALEEAHAQGIVHRDLKPENIMIDRRGMPVIMDFGLAKISTINMNAAATQAGTILGSPAYMSPEQASGNVKEIDQRSDIYSLGVILYELLTGHWPFAGTTMQILGQKSLLDPASPIRINPRIPPQLAAVSLKMIARESQHRYQSLAEVSADLMAIDLTMVDTTPEPSESALERPSADLDDLVIPDSLKQSLAQNARQKAATVSFEGRNVSNLVETRLLRAERWWSNLNAPFKWTALGGLGAALVAWGAIIFFTTRYGVVQFEILDPTLSVRFDGASFTIDNDGKPLRISATSRHQLEVLQNGIALQAAAKELEIKNGEKRIITVKLLAGQVVIDDNGVPRTVTEKLPEVSATQKPSTAPTDRRATTNGLGEWRIDGDELVQSQELKANMNLAFGSPDWSDYDYTFEVKATGGHNGFKAIFHQTDISTYYEFSLGNYGNAFHDLGSWTRGAWHRMNGMIKPGTIEQNVWYAVRVQVRGPKMTCYLNGIEQFTSEDPAFVRGRCGVSVYECAARFRNFLVTQPDGKIVWQGLPELTGRLKN